MLHFRNTNEKTQRAAFCECCANNILSNFVCFTIKYPPSLLHHLHQPSHLLRTVKFTNQLSENSAALSVPQLNFPSFYLPAGNETSLELPVMNGGKHSCCFVFSSCPPTSALWTSWWSHLQHRRKISDIVSVFLTSVQAALAPRQYKPAFKATIKFRFGFSAQPAPRHAFPFREAATWKTIQAPFCGEHL